MIQSSTMQAIVFVDGEQVEPKRIGSQHLYQVELTTDKPHAVRIEFTSIAKLTSIVSMRHDGTRGEEATLNTNECHHFGFAGVIPMQSIDMNWWVGTEGRRSTNIVFIEKES